MATESPQTKPVAPDEIEPKAITFIGGPLNGRKRADHGQTDWSDPRTGDQYRRVKLDAGDDLGCMTFCVMAYFGRE